VAKKADLPSSFADMENCKACQVASHHLKNPQDENSGIKTYVLNKGKPGLDTFGDSVAVGPRNTRHAKITAVVSAPAGTTLYFLCVVHPWMQGKIVVK
jgi:hypothetical protein